VVPACAALDCLTVFARSVSEGAAIMAVMEGADAGPADVWRRLRLTLPGLPQQGFRFGVPSEEFTEFDGPGRGPSVTATQPTRSSCCIPSAQMRRQTSALCLAALSTA
jgi:Asp-tRNA(Asn)/Glu-tRNA(Gln) amidotransferase A subunit family amidase